MSTIPILFGTETGNAEYCAKELKAALTKSGYSAQVVDMNRYGAEQLAAAPLVLIITSTYGKGDPPVNAEKLLKHLESDQPQLSHLRYAVCALGDSTYQDFAQCGRDFDRHLERHGARRVVDLVICDVEFEEFFPKFKESVLAWVATTGDEFRGADAPSTPKRGFFARLFGRGKAAEPTVASESLVMPEKAGPAASEHDPVFARVLRRRRLNGEGSAKETMHYELSLDGSGIHYEPGDCIAVHPRNSHEDVSRFLAAFGLDGATTVVLDGHAHSLAQALATRDFHRITSGLAELLARGQGPLSAAGVDAKDYRHRRHLIEAVTEHRDLPSLPAQELLEMLLPAPPRLYSIASSQKLTPGEVHLTVETPRYELDGHGRVGLASGYLCDRVKDGEQIVIHKVAGPHFRVAPSGTDMILIGPGTGVAPYRAFLHERRAQNAAGRIWLFFGHQHRDRDFLYGEELEGFVRDGLLTKLDCAWSRDGAEKRYVQHVMREQAAELHAWIQAGAILYVCGDKQHMAADVHRALVEIVAQQGGLAAEQAEQFVKQLETDGRYRLDVY
ncbi:MAG TPA: sulfite reductase flavoprotein subunit alpha [Polyangiaceae bacterium]|nr:sulfite reductase flavoprotein subunit alpha [Polyangiaceae bacterium]